MAEAETTDAAKTPVWFWIVAGLATIWNFFGVVDYLFARLAPEMYAAQMTPEQVAYYESFPIWYSAIWALAVWLAFLASVALLLRSRFAFIMFAVSLIGFVINSIYSFGFTDAAEIMGGGLTVFTAIIFLSLAALTWFSHQWSKSGLLR
jgi:hypothetical protein